MPRVTRYHYRHNDEATALVENPARGMRTQADQVYTGVVDPPDETAGLVPGTLFVALTDDACK